MTALEHFNLARAYRHQAFEVLNFVVKNGGAAKNPEKFKEAESLFRIAREHEDIFQAKTKRANRVFCRNHGITCTR